jgi:hypothetical protein
MFIAKQRLGKQVSEKMNMHATTELPFLCKGDETAPLEQNQNCWKTMFSVEAAPGRVRMPSP